MRISCSTNCIREKTITAALEILAEAGYTAAEVRADQLRSCGETPEQVRRRAVELGLHLSFHAASADLNISSINPGIRRESIRQMEETLEVADRLGASTVAMHPGHLSSKRGSVEQAWELFLEALAPIDERAARYGLKLGIETMEKKPKEFFVYPTDVHRLCGHPWRATGVTVDLVHASSMMDPTEYLESVPRDSLFHVHLGDSSPEENHLPLGKGVLKLPELLAALQQRFDGLVVLEGYLLGRGPESVAANVAYLRALGYMAGPTR